ncbi:MAG: hypothetical protein ACC634_08230, partial [Hyphomicrobiales bacterium]
HFDSGHGHADAPGRTMTTPDTPAMANLPAKCACQPLSSVVMTDILNRFGIVHELHCSYGLFLEKR